MEYRQFYACDASGKPAAGASVEVFLAGTQTAASLFDTTGDALSNPLVAGNSGRVGFAAANGDYDIVVAGGAPERAYLFDPGNVDGEGIDSAVSQAASTASAASSQANSNATGLAALSASVAGQIAAAAAATALLLGQINTANADIAALTQTYGDTAAAAASAQAASAASTAATTAQGAAQTAASQATTAQGQASAAETAAQTAQAAAQQQAQASAQSATSAAGSATSASGSATSASGSAGSASQSASAAQVSAQTAQTQAGLASSSATSAAGSATSAQGYANTAYSQATNAAASATTAAGSATSAQTAAGQASTFAGQSATSASASSASAVQATAAAASALPANMAVPGTWSASASFPNTPYAATDYHFLTAADGTAVFRSDATVLDYVVTGGQLTPVTGRTYQVSCVGRFFVTPGSSTVGSKLYADIIGLGSNGAVSSLTSAGVDSTGTAAGTLVTTTTTWACTGSPAISAIKARAIPNAPNSGTTYSPAQWDVISLRLADITESTLATTQATAAANSASQASASQSAASQSASAASTQATNAQTYAGNASTSAGQASTSASTASTSAQNAGAYATNSANSATTSGNSASAANSSATAASSSASAASSSASSAQSYSQQASTSAGTAGTQATNASNSASSASSSAVAASNSAAAAQQSYNLAATVGSGALNNNPTFASYAGTGALPSGWADGGNATGASYATTGFDSPNAIGFDCTGSYSGSSVELTQLPGGTGANPGLSYAGPGWYVLEVDIYCRSQANAQSAAVYAVSYSQTGGGGSLTVTPLVVTLQVTPDINGASGQVGGRRQYRVLGYISSAASLGVIIQPNGANGVTASSKNEYHRVLLRAASQAEVNGNQALTSANTNTANFSSFQSAQTSQNSAFSTSINSLNAAVFNASGGSLQSQISAVSQTQATQQSTFASQISTLQSQVTLGQNLVADGGLTNNGSVWLVKPQAVYVQPGYPGRLGYVAGITASEVSMETGQFGVVAGSTYTATGNIQASLASGSGTVTCALCVVFFNSSGANLGKDVNTGSLAFSLSPSGPNATLTFTAPANATSAALYIYTQIANGSSPSVTQYVSRLKCETGSTYTGWSDDASAITLSATVFTQSASIATLQGQLFATYTLIATAGNVITGMQLLSASGATTISAVVFQAENFLIKSSAANATFSPFAYNSATGTLQVQNVIIAGNLIVGGTVTYAQMAAGAVTTIFYVYSNNTTSISVSGSSAPTTAPPTSGSGGAKAGSNQL